MSATFNAILSFSVTGGDQISDVQMKLTGLNDTMGDTSDSAQMTNTSMMSQVGTFTRVAGSAALVMGSMMQLQMSQVRVERESEMLQSRQLTLQNSQMAYNEAVAKYGPASEQAVKAHDNLEKAQLSLTSVQQRLNMMQEQEYMQLLPMALGLISSLTSSYEVILPLIAARTAETEMLNAALETEAEAEAAVSGGLAAPGELVGAGSVASMFMALGAAGGALPGMQHGGPLMSTGYFYGHAGEYVVPAGGSGTMSPSAYSPGAGGGNTSVYISLDANAQDIMRVTGIEYEYDNQRRGPIGYGV